MLSDTKTIGAGTDSQSSDIVANTSSIYTKKWFENRQAQTSEAALRIISYVLEVIQPGSVVDVGCGTGEFLEAFRRHGIEDIQGIDGMYIRRDLLVIPQETFKPLDLNRPFTLDRRFDLAACLEVAEHLRPESATQFVTSLTQLAPIILFSAAIPYQGGTGHLNEQWPEYWAKLFKQHGFVPVDALRRDIWLDCEIPSWYRQNMLFFCKEEALAGNEKLNKSFHDTNPNALSAVHPEMYIACMLGYNRLYLRITQYIFTHIIQFWRIKKWFKKAYSSISIENRKG